ncbi:MAG TPA: carbohydrate porin [Burkholderiaceae bacterium]|nr:carbohydrate porin [Burkholderiaceae bacterium]
MTHIKKYFHEAALSLAIVVSISLFCIFPSFEARADDSNEQSAPANDSWSLHGQFTNITQEHPQFTAPYSGPNSLSANGPTEETTDATLFAGLRLPHDAEFWIDAEIDQGLGLDNTLGVAGFPSGGAYKVGANTPYLRLPRAFIRQVYSLGGEQQKIDSAANQLDGTRAENNLILTIGKFSVVDIFDANSYAHDPRADFLNWSLIDGGTFDYAADSWGYTYGAAIEWSQDWWTLRGGVFQLSSVPNTKISRVDFSEYSVVLEAEERHHLLSHTGKIKLLAFVNRANMANYNDAVQLARETDTTPDVALVRYFSSRPGVVLNMEQELSSDIGAFVRASASDGQKEAYEFSDIDQSVSAGLSIKGDRWSRHEDTIGIAAVANRISGAAQSYFAAGGMGILIGDGKLNYAPEKILESYYSMNLISHVALTFDYQYVTNPAYNQDRGPVSFYALRLHGDF